MGAASFSGRGGGCMCCCVSLASVTRGLGLCSFSPEQVASALGQTLWPPAPLLKDAGGTVTPPTSTRARAPCCYRPETPTGAETSPASRIFLGQSRADTCWGEGNDMARASQELSVGPSGPITACQAGASTSVPCRPRGLAFLCPTQHGGGADP